MTEFLTLPINVIQIICVNYSTRLGEDICKYDNIHIGYFIN